METFNPSNMPPPSPFTPSTTSTEGTKQEKTTKSDSSEKALPNPISTSQQTKSTKVSITPTTKEFVATKKEAAEKEVLRGLLNPTNDPKLADKVDNAFKMIKDPKTRESFLKELPSSPTLERFNTMVNLQLRMKQFDAKPTRDKPGLNLVKTNLPSAEATTAKTAAKAPEETSKWEGFFREKYVDNSRDELNKMFDDLGDTSAAQELLKEFEADMDKFDKALQPGADKTSINDLFKGDESVAKQRISLFREIISERTKQPNPASSAATRSETATSKTVEKTPQQIGAAAASSENDTRGEMLSKIRDGKVLRKVSKEEPTTKTAQTSTEPHLAIRERIAGSKEEDEEFDTFDEGEHVPDPTFPASVSSSATATSASTVPSTEKASKQEQVKKEQPKEKPKTGFKPFIKSSPTPAQSTAASPKPAALDARGDLLASIRKGKKLKKTDDDETSKSPNSAPEPKKNIFGMSAERQKEIEKRSNSAPPIEKTKSPDVDESEW